MSYKCSIIHYLKIYLAELSKEKVLFPKIVSFWFAFIFQLPAVVCGQSDKRKLFWSSQRSSLSFFPTKKSPQHHWFLNHFFLQCCCQWQCHWEFKGNNNLSLAEGPWPSSGLSCTWENAAEGRGFPSNLKTLQWANCYASLCRTFGRKYSELVLIHVWIQTAAMWSMPKWQRMPKIGGVRYTSCLLRRSSMQPGKNHPTIYTFLEISKPSSPLQHPTNWIFLFRFLSSQCRPPVIGFILFCSSKTIGQQFQTEPV